MIRKLFIGLALLCLPLIALANNVTQYRLNNGLTLIVKEDHRAPVVFTSVWYKVGGSYEHNGITGISHVLEHMMFRGTQKYPAGTLEKLMAQNGGQQNAMTANDQTMYYQQLSVDKLPLSFKLEADRMNNLTLSKKDFEKEIQVVMEERRMRFDDNPNATTYERFMATAFVNNPYHHQAIGWMTDLKHMTVQNVRDWYHTWYVPNNAILVVVGDVQPKRVLALAKQYFSPLKARPVPVLKPRTEIPQIGTKHVDVYAPAKLPLLLMGYQTPSLVTAKEKWEPYALDVLSAILAGGDSSRLTENLVRGQQMAITAQASYNLYTLHSSLFLLAGVPTPGHSIKQLQEALSKQVSDIQMQLVSPQELERVKAQVIAQNVYEKDSLSNQAMDIGIPETIGLSWRVDARYVTEINKVTAKEVQEVAKRYLTSKRLTIAVLHPTPIHGKEPVVTQPLSAPGIH